MKIAVIGAAGRTGRQVVRQALDRGHEVVAVARSPEKLNMTGDRLTVVAADVHDADALARAVVGTDAIVTTFGAAAGRKPTDVYSAGITNVLAAIDGGPIRRLAVISASPVGPRAEQPAAFRLMVLPILDRVVRRRLRRPAADGGGAGAPRRSGVGLPASAATAGSAGERRVSARATPLPRRVH